MFFSSDYPYLVSLLKYKNENVEDYRHQKIILEIFGPYLATLLEPYSLVCQLKNAGLIDTMDEQEICVRLLLNKTNLKQYTYLEIIILDAFFIRFKERIKIIFTFIYY